MAGLQEEVTKTYRMIKEAGFEIVDVIFEGAMTVKGKELLGQIEALSTERKAMGVVRIVYSAGENQIRAIEIPAGEVLPEMKGEEAGEAEIDQV